ncbi:MAG: LPS-assembly protein LptD [Planctomycetota bacterium]
MARACAAVIAASTALAAPGHAQDRIVGAPITGDRLGGFVLPTEPGTWDLTVSAKEANAWKVETTQRLYVRGDVRVRMGAYDFTADRAVLWVERIPSAKGLITQLAIWFPETIEPTKAAGLGAGGANLFVTASTYGSVSLSAILFDPVAPAATPDLARAQQRLAAYLGGLATAPPPIRILPEVIRPTPPAPPPPLVVGGVAPMDPSVAAAIETASQRSAVRDVLEFADLPPAPVAPVQPGQEFDPAADRPMVAPDSTVAFAAEDVHADASTDTVQLTTGVAIDVLPRFDGGATRALQMHADRAVVFLRPGTLDALRQGPGEVRADAVIGVYLEGDVHATDFRYAIRARRAYYDFASNRASMVDGVLRTKDRRGVPLVARARELRQYSADQFQAEGVKVSMSEFFEPHLSIGAERATITQTEAWDGTATSRLSARNVTFNAGKLPFFWLPTFEADGTLDPPISRISGNYNEITGAQIETRWRLFSLLGLAPPPDVDLNVVALGYTNWGVGLGLEGNVLGTRLDLLGIYDFQNEEQTSAGQRLVSPNAWRGTAAADRTFAFTDTAKLQLQASYVSDEAFLQTWRQREFSNSTQRETSAYFVETEERSELSVLINTPTNGVITSSAQLAARPYQVLKYPEAAYKRWGDSLFGDTIAWQQEYSANLMAIEYGTGSAASTGVRANAFNLNNQPIPGGAYNANTTLTQLYGDQGYNESSTVRLYTRQELSSTFGESGWKFTPFASVTAIGYLGGDIESYGSAADSFRALVAGGFRSSADIVADHDRVSVPALDLNRMRHVLTPYVNGWAGWNTAQNLAYAVYDQEIEGATGSAAIQAGVRQRFQTMRGGPGNWQSVDWLTVDAGLTWNESGDDLARNYESGARYRQSPFPQYFAWRPELSQWGRNAYANFMLAASNTLTFRGNVTYLLQDSLPDFGSGAFGLDNAARGSLGASIQHAPDVTSFIEYRGINNFAPENQYVSDALLAGGVSYQIGKAYSASFVPTYDLKENDFRAFNLNIAREMPDFTLLGSFGYDAIQDQFFGGINISIGGVSAPGGLVGTRGGLLSPESGVNR